MNYQDMTVEALEDEKTRIAQEMRALEDKIEAIEQVIQDKLVSERLDREIADTLARIPPERRDAFIKGVQAAAGGSANGGTV